MGNNKKREIYSLIARNKANNETIVIELTNRKEDKYLAYLSYIDNLTTFFKNENELINQLYNNNYIDFKNADIYIEYQYHGYRKFTEVLYRDNRIISNLNMDNTHVNKVDSNYDFIFRQYISNINNPAFLSFIKKDNRVSEFFVNKIENYLNSKNQGYFYNNYKYISFLKSMEKAFDNYKLFRDFNFICKEFNNPDYKNNVIMNNELRLQTRKAKEVIESIDNKQITIQEYLECLNEEKNKNLDNNLGDLKIKTLNINDEIK